jgi:hypothetical protein
MDFEWGADNLRHVGVDRPRGITPTLVIEIAINAPVLVDNPAGEGRSGSHKLIGPNNTGRMWTIILIHRYGDLWRPITGWPSTNSEIRIHKEAGENRDQ